MIRILLIATMLLMAAPGIVLADSISENWDDGDDGGWQPNTILTIIEVMPSGGVGDSGYLNSAEIDNGYNIVGAVQRFAPYVGDYGAYGYRHVRVALQFRAGDFTLAVFRVRYQDSGFNGWYVPLTEDFSAELWHECSVDFDPDWSDGEAIAAGWVQEDPSGTFQETMANVYTAEIRVFGMGDLEIGIDEFGLDGGLVPSETGSWSRIKSLY